MASDSTMKVPTPTAAILLVDDREDNLDAFEAILKDFEHEIVRARSGQEALCRLFDRDFAVILLDVRMPDMNGFEAAQLIRKRQRSRHTPIIFITAADVTPEHIVRGYSAGAVDFLFKPFMPEVLRAKVRIFLDLFQKAEELRESEARLRTLMVNVPCALYRRQVEPPWELYFVSDPIEQLVGIPAAEFTDRRRTFASVIYPDDVHAFSTALAEAVRRGAPYAIEYRILRPDGRIGWVLDQGHTVGGDAGQAGYLDGILLEVTAQKVAQEMLRDALRRLLEIQDNERRRVALELHDQTSPLLTALTSKLYALRHRSRTLDPATAQTLEASMKLADDTSSILRDMSQLLYPRLLEDSGLLAGLRWYFSDFTKRTGIPVHLKLPAEAVRLSRDAELALFRVAQESISNVLGQFQGQAVTVSIEVKAESLMLEMTARGRDDGKKGEKTARDSSFVGMRERMRQLDGTLEIHAGHSATTVTAVVPLKAPRP